MAYDLTKESNVNMLKSSVCSTGVNFKDLALIFNGKKLEGACNIVDAGLVNNSTVQAVVGVQGKHLDFIPEKVNSTHFFSFENFQTQFFGNFREEKINFQQKKI